LKNYDFVLTRFEDHFGNIDLNSITTDNILAFLLKISEGTKQSTKKLRYSLLSAFFNFINTSLDPGFQNPCDSPNLRKIFKPQRPIHWEILEKDCVLNKSGLALHLALPIEALCRNPIILRSHFFDTRARWAIVHLQKNDFLSPHRQISQSAHEPSGSLQ